MNVQEYFSTTEGASKKNAVIEYMGYLYDVIGEVNNRYENLINETVRYTLSNDNICICVNMSNINMSNIKIWIIDNNGRMSSNNSFDICFNSSDIKLCWYAKELSLTSEENIDGSQSLLSTINELINNKNVINILMDINKKWETEYSWNVQQIKKCNDWLNYPFDKPFPLRDVF